MTRLCLCGLPVVALLVLAAPPQARGDGSPAVVKPDEAAPTPPNPAPATGEEAPQGTPLWVWAGGAIAAALFAVGLMIRVGMNHSPPSRLAFPPVEIPPPEGQPGEEYYPDDPSAQQQP